MRLKRQLVKIHKWVGLTLALVVLSQALTGLLLIYRTDIHTWLAPNPGPNPDVVSEAMAGTTNRTTNRTPNRMASADELVHAIQTRYPGFSLSRLVFPDSDDQRYIAYLQSNADPDEQRVIDFAWPPDALEQGSSFAMSALQAVYDLHHTLLSGTVGRYIVGAMGLGLLFMIMSGIVIWWPKGRRFRQALTIHKYRQAVAFFYQLHRTTGVAASTMLVIFVTTGVMLSFGPELRSALNVSQGIALPVHETGSCSASTVDQQIAAAQAVFPTATVHDIRFFQGGTELQKVLFANHSAAGESPPHLVWLDQCSGKPVKFQTAQAGDPVDQIFAWLYPIHTGRALGRPGQVVNLITGLLLLTGVFSALLLWLKRRRKPAYSTRQKQA